MTRKKAAANKVARAAAAAAAAAVQASQSDADKVTLNWGTDDDEEDEETASEVLEGLEQLDPGDGNITWELYCNTPGEKHGRVRKLTTDELRDVQDECLLLGPGEYHVVARHKNGLFVKGTRRKIKVSSLAKPAAPAAGAPAFDPMTFMAQLEERAERRRAEERASRNAQIKFWAPILAPIGLEFAKGLFNRGGGEPLKDLVAALVGMKDLTGGNKGSDVDTLLKGIELARDLNPGDSKGATWPDVLVNGVTTIAKEFRPLAEHLATRRNGTPVAATQPPQLQFQTQQPAAPQAGAPAPAAGAPAAGEVDPMFAMFEPLLRKLAGELEEFAVNNADPGLACDALMAKIPAMVRSQLQPEQLKEWLTQANWWEVLVRFHAPLQHYQAYCNDVRVALLEAVEEQLNPPPPDEESTDD